MCESASKNMLQHPVVNFRYTMWKTIPVKHKNPHVLTKVTTYNGNTR